MSTDDTVILQGKLSEDYTMLEVLRGILSRPDVRLGVLQVVGDGRNGTIAFNGGVEIAGALLEPDHSQGVEALQALFSFNRGDYVFRRVDGEQPELNQSLKLSIDKLFLQMNKAIAESKDTIPEPVKAAAAPGKALPARDSEQAVSGKTSTPPAPAGQAGAPQVVSAEPAAEESEGTPLGMMLLAATALILTALLVWQTSGVFIARLHVTSGITALVRGSPDMAVKEFTAALTSDPQMKLACFYRAIAYSRIGEPEKAVDDYTAAIDDDRRNQNALVGRACQYLNLKEYRNARADCDEVLKLSAKNADAYRLQAIAASKMGAYDQAVAACKRYLKLADGKKGHLEKADIYAVLAQAHLRTDEFGTAIEDYSRAIEMDTGSSNLFAGRANAFKMAGDWKNALSDCNKAIALGAGWEVYQLRGMCRQASGQPEQALPDFEIALRLSPQNLAILRQRADVHMALKHFAPAAQDYHLLLNSSPHDAELLGQYERAVQHLGGRSLLLADLANQNAEPVAPVFKGDSATLMRRGYEFLQQGQAPAAVAVFTQVLKGDPNNFQCRRYLAHALLLSRQPALAVQQFALVAKGQGLDGQDKIYLGQALDQAGETAQAIGVYEGLLAADARNKSVRLTLIDLYQRAGLTQKAAQSASDGMRGAANVVDRAVFEQRLKDISAPKKNNSPDSQA